MIRTVYKKYSAKTILVFYLTIYITQNDKRPLQTHLNLMEKNKLTNNLE